jgi:hypothetical protein
MTDPRHEHAPRLVATTADDIEHDGRHPQTFKSTTTQVEMLPRGLGKMLPRPEHDTPGGDIPRPTTSSTTADLRQVGPTPQTRPGGMTPG